LTAAANVEGKLRPPDDVRLIERNLLVPAAIRPARLHTGRAQLVGDVGDCLRLTRSGRPTSEKIVGGKHANVVCQAGGIDRRAGAVGRALGPLRDLWGAGDQDQDGERADGELHDGSFTRRR
jgi:hypothetical protein